MEKTNEQFLRDLKADGPLTEGLSDRPGHKKDDLHVFKWKLSTNNAPLELVEESLKAVKLPFS